MEHFEKIIRRISAVFFATIILIGGVAIPPTENAAADLTIGETFRINGDDEFTAANGVINEGAAGTEVDPYIIAGWDINGDSGTDCMFIGNTTKHLVIKDCYLHDSTGKKSKALVYNAGVTLYNATNVTVTNVTLIGNAVGIYINCTDAVIRVDNCTISENQGGGIQGYVAGNLSIEIADNVIGMNQCTGDASTTGGGIRFLGTQNITTSVSALIENNHIDMTLLQGGCVRVGFDYGSTLDKAYVTMRGNNLSGYLSALVRVYCRTLSQLECVDNVFYDIVNAPVLKFETDNDANLTFSRNLVRETDDLGDEGIVWCKAKYNATAVFQNNTVEHSKVTPVFLVQPHMWANVTFTGNHIMDIFDGAALQVEFNLDSFINYTHNHIENVFMGSAAVIDTQGHVTLNFTDNYIKNIGYGDVVYLNTNETVNITYQDNDVEVFYYSNGLNCLAWNDTTVNMTGNRFEYNVEGSILDLFTAGNATINMSDNVVSIMQGDIAIINSNWSQNCTFLNNQFIGIEGQGIYLDPHEGCNLTVSGSILDTMGFPAIVLNNSQSSNLTVVGNRLGGTIRALSRDTMNLDARNNILLDGASGIDIGAPTYQELSVKMLNATVVNNTFSNGSAVFLMAQDMLNATFRDNTLANNRDGAVMIGWNGRGDAVGNLTAIVEGNSFQNNLDGPVLLGANSTLNATVCNNTIDTTTTLNGDSVRGAIDIRGPTTWLFNCTVRNNSINDFGNSAITVEGGEGCCEVNVSLNNVQSGIPEQDICSGVRLIGTVKGTVNNNTVQKVTGTGVYVEGSSKVNITHNNIESCGGYGIYLDSQSDRCYVHSNDLVNNNKRRVQGLDDGDHNNWNNSKRGNYWYDFIKRYVPPATNDGTVWDTPYATDGSSSSADNYPLANRLFFGYRYSLPVRIDGDGDFAGSPAVTGGSGTSEDPYIIEKMEIDGSGSGFCIYVGNTTKHFIIRDCTLGEASGRPGVSYYMDSGVVLYNARNGLVTDNLIRDCQGYAVHLSGGSSSNRIHSNDLVSNREWTGSQGYDSGTANSWDDGAGEGNFWFDYKKYYVPPATAAGQAWSVSYSIDGPTSSVDGYPLVEPVTSNSFEHDPIRIDSVADCTPQNGVVAGNGTEGNPYLIERWYMDAQGDGCGIFIGNLSENLTIQGCQVFDTDGNDREYYRNAGIYFHDTDNVKIVSSRIINCGIGIYMDLVDSAISIDDCLVSDNDEGGIFGMVTTEVDLSIGDSNIKKNGCSGDEASTGGGIRIHGTSKETSQIRADIHNTRVDQSITSGGAVRLGYTSSGPTSQTTWLNCSGINISSMEWGGISVHSQDQTTVNIRQSGLYFIHQGGVNASSENLVTVDMSENEAALVYGGLLRTLAGGDLTCTFQENDARSLPDLGMALNGLGKATLMMSHNRVETRGYPVLETRGFSRSSLRVTDNHLEGYFSLSGDELIELTCLNNVIANSGGPSRIGGNGSGVDDLDAVFIGNTITNSGGLWFKPLINLDATLTGNFFSGMTKGTMRLGSECVSDPATTKYVRGSVSGNNITDIQGGAIMARAAMGLDLAIYDNYINGMICISGGLNRSAVELIGGPACRMSLNVHHNQVQDFHTAGIWVQGGAQNQVNIHDNFVAFGVFGFFTGTGIFLHSTHHVNVYSNTIQKIDDYGVYIMGSHQNVVEGNNFLTNHYGVYMEDSQYNTVVSNTFRRNQKYAVYINGTSEHNTVHHNTFRGNNDGGVQAFDSSTGVGNPFWGPVGEGNIWEDYSKRYPLANLTGAVWDTPYELDGGANADMAPLASLPERDPIRIDNDAQFLMSNGVVAGDGSEGNPYIISGWDIDGSGPGYCIYIGNTTKYFLIRNNTLHHASGDDGTFCQNAGILLRSANNGTIEGNTISHCEGYGIMINGTSSDNIVFGNHLIDNNGGSVQGYDWGISNLWTNVTEGGNYWNDMYTLFPEATNDGMYWDTSYPIDGPSGSNDTSPLTAGYNYPPRITFTPVTGATEDMKYQTFYTAHEPDPGTTLDWEVITDADWLVMDPSTGELSGTPENAHVGNNTVTVRVDDGDGGVDIQTFNITVINTNDPPMIATQPLGSAVEGIAYSVDYDAQDPDPTQDDLTWSIQTDALFLSIDPISGILSGMPDNSDVGIYTVKVIVTDSGGLNDTDQFTLVVENVNDDPQVTTIPPVFALEDQLYRVEFQALDPDPTGELLSWNLSTDAAWLSINTTTGVLEGTPRNSDVGDFWVQVHCSDGLGGLDTLGYLLTVNNTNDPPVIQTADVVSASAQKTYFVAYTALDMDPTRDDLTWDLSTNASWLDMDNLTGVLSGTPTLSDLGSFWVNISVYDGLGGHDHTNFTIMVVDLNDPPDILTTPPMQAQEDSEYDVSFEARDNDPDDQLTWEINSEAAWLSMERNTGVLGGIPQNDDVGTFEVTVTVRDGNGGNDSLTYSLEVVNTNDPPKITSETVTTALEDSEFVDRYKAVDPDPTADILTWELDTDAGWLSIDPDTGMLTGIPNNQDVGSYDVTVTVKDGNGGEDSRTFTLVVENTNDPPSITTTDIESAAQGEPYIVDYIALDPDPTYDVLTWHLSTNASWLSLNLQSGRLEGTPDVSDVGRYWVNISVRDGQGGSDHHNITLTVHPFQHQTFPVVLGPVLYDDGSPAADVTIRLDRSSRAEFEAITNSTGHAVFEKLLPGAYDGEVETGEDSVNFKLVLTDSGTPLYDIPPLPLSPETSGDDDTDGPGDDGLIVLVDGQGLAITIEQGEERTLIWEGTNQTIKCTSIRPNGEEMVFDMGGHKDLVLKRGTPINLDLDGDGQEDLSVTFVGLDMNGNPLILLDEPHEEKTDTEEDQEGGGSTFLVMLVVILIAIVLVLLLLVFRSRGEYDALEEGEEVNEEEEEDEGDEDKDEDDLLGEEDDPDDMIEDEYEDDIAEADVLEDLDMEELENGMEEEPDSRNSDAGRKIKRSYPKRKSRR